MAFDRSPRPAYKPSLQINEVVNNKESGRLMVALENTGDGPLYYGAETKVKVDGADFRVFGEQEVRLLERGESAGLEYPLDLSGVDGGGVSASVVAKYGSSRLSLDQFAAYNGGLGSISYIDQSNVSVRSARYDRENGRILVSIKNDGDLEAFVFSKLTLVAENGAPLKVSSPAVREIEPGSIHVEEFPLELSQAEISLNKEVMVSIDYGGRKGFLNKNISYAVPLEGDSGGLLLYGAAALAVCVVALLAYLAYRFVAGRMKGKRKPKRK